jgi:hypothetical protein
MSRDREGAGSKLPYKHRHWLSLPLHNISNRCRNLIPMRQPSRAAVPRPSLSIRWFLVGLIQSPTRVGFEGIHDFFRFLLGLDNCVNMGGAHVRSEKRPAPMQANFSDGFEHFTSGGGIQFIASLIHEMALARYPGRAGLKSSMSWDNVVPVHGTRFAAVQMRAIAGESYQVGQTRIFYPAPSRSRLGTREARLVY